MHLRGLIEFSNRCRNNCLYCGLQRKNQNLVRLLMPDINIPATTAIEALPSPPPRTDNRPTIRCECRYAQYDRDKVSRAPSRNPVQPQRPDHGAAYGSHSVPSTPADRHSKMPPAPGFPPRGVLPPVLIVLFPVPFSNLLPVIEYSLPYHAPRSLSIKNQLKIAIICGGGGCGAVHIKNLTKSALCAIITSINLFKGFTYVLSFYSE